MGGCGTAICSYLSKSSCLDSGCSLGSSHRCRTDRPSRRPARSRAFQVHTCRQLGKAFEKRRILINTQNFSLVTVSNFHLQVSLHSDSNEDVRAVCQHAVSHRRVYGLCFYLAVIIIKLIRFLEHWQYFFAVVIDCKRG